MQLSFLDNIFTGSDFYGFTAAFLTTLAFLPQLIKTFKTKSADDVSSLTLTIFLIGLMFWVVYGFKGNSLPIIIANVITFILNLSILFLKIKFRR